MSVLDDKDEFEPLITLEGVRYMIKQFQAQEAALIKLKAQRSGTDMILARLRSLETALLREVDRGEQVRL